MGRSLFLCASPNPAMDKRIRVERLLRGEVNRAQYVEAFAGGKATHVAMVLETLDAKPEWIGPCGGLVGKQVLDGLSRLGIEASASPIEGETRVNLEILENDGTVTEILEPGPSVSAKEWDRFIEGCKERFARGGERLCVIFSGSLPMGTAPDLYARLVEAARAQKCQTMLDTSGEALRLGLEARPDFVKPNREEAGRLLGTAIDSLPSALAAVQRLLALGAKSAALSLGGDGLLYSTRAKEPVLHAKTQRIRSRSTVGCGDSAVAGFAFGIRSALLPEETLRLAASCAAANCLADRPGAARIDEIRHFEKQVTVEKLEVRV